MLQACALQILPFYKNLHLLAHLCYITRLNLQSLLAWQKSMFALVCFPLEHAREIRIIILKKCIDRSSWTFQLPWVSFIAFASCEIWIAIRFKIETIIFSFCSPGFLSVYCVWNPDECLLFLSSWCNSFSVFETVRWGHKEADNLWWLQLCNSSKALSPEQVGPKLLVSSSYN